MNYFVLVGLVLLAVVVKIETRPEDEITPTSEEVSKADTVENDDSKSGEDSTATSTETIVEEKSGENTEKSDYTDPKVKGSIYEAYTQETSGDISTEEVTIAATVDESEFENDETDSNSSESTETPKTEEREAIEEKSAAKVYENKSDDNGSGVAERTGAVESMENNYPLKEELVSSAEVSTLRDAVWPRSAYRSSSILETKGRSGDSGKTDSSEQFRGRAHINLLKPPISPIGVINKLNDIGSRRMDQPNLTFNSPQRFPPIHDIIPKTVPPLFKSYLNSATSLPNVAETLGQDQMGYHEVFQPETNAYPYSPTSSQQVDSQSKVSTLRDPSKFSSYPNNFYKPYDQNYSSDFGARSRRLTVPVPDTMNMPTRYLYTNFGYSHYIK